MFDAIADRYDLLNRLMSLGIDQSWRRRAVRLLQLAPDARVLDLATGTGDLALLLSRAAPEGRVVGLDPSRGMLKVAQAKLERHGLTPRVELVCGDAEQLPFESASFDAVTIAFGIRNVVDRPRALREMARVLVPSGRALVLELTDPKDGLLAPLARAHVHGVLPRLGALLSGRREYRYLERSIAAFPPAEVFATLMRDAGFVRVDVERLTLGTCHLFLGRLEGA